MNRFNLISNLGYEGHTLELLLQIHDSDPQIRLASCKALNNILTLQNISQDTIHALRSFWEKEKNREIHQELEKLLTTNDPSFQEFSKEKEKILSPSFITIFHNNSQIFYLIKI